MLNQIWLALILLAVFFAGFGGRIKELTEGAVKGAETAVTLSLGLIGVMAVWLGLMRLAEKSGLVQALARTLHPLLRRLFPEVPLNHPAMGAMVMNIAANMLGLNNAATPLGLRAMKDLETLNPRPGTATNAMCTFLAINTSSVQLIPITAIAVLAAAGSAHPTAIVGTALLATICSTAAGLLAVKTLEKLRIFRLPRSEARTEATRENEDAEPGAGPKTPTPATPPRAAASRWGWLVLLAFAAAFGWFLFAEVFPALAGRLTPSEGTGANVPVRVVNAISLLAVPFLIAFFPLYAALRGIRVYEEFIEGAKEGFQVGVRIIPYLVAMLVAIGMFRGAGGIEYLTRVLKPVLDGVGFPSELLPMAMMRPLSGSGTLALFSDLVTAHGPDHLLSRMGGTLFGSTETTFYVIAVYFGSVGVTRTRHAVPAGLIADGVGMIASVIICRMMFA